MIPLNSSFAENHTKVFGSGFSRGLLMALSLWSGMGDVRADLDADGNLLSDVWQKKFGVGAISRTADADGDGFTNGQEFLFATNPMDSGSRPSMTFSLSGPDLLDTSWHGEPGKLYDLETSTDLAAWTRQLRQTGNGKTLAALIEGVPGQPLFTRVGASDVDTDLDGLSDWEERVSGFNPARVYSEGLGTVPSTTDKQRLTTTLNTVTNTITVAAADPAMNEDWPDPGRFVIRRVGNLDKVTVSFSYGGTATNGVDYSAPSALVTIPFGVDEATVQVTPLTDAEVEVSETVTLTLLTGTGYTLGAASSATLNLADSTGGMPTSKAAARFLTRPPLAPHRRNSPA